MNNEKYLHDNLKIYQFFPLTLNINYLTIVIFFILIYISSSRLAYLNTSYYRHGPSYSIFIPILTPTEITNFLTFFYYTI